ncbi:hypothetical protein [Streptomyces sennicomposti]
MADGEDPDKVLDIRTADIERAAPDFDKGAEDLSKALTALVKSLDELGEPWGHDKHRATSSATPTSRWRRSSRARRTSWCSA